VDLVNGVDRRFGVVGRPHLAPAFHNPYSFGLWDSLIALLVLVGLALFPDSTCVCRCLRLSLFPCYHGPCSVDFRFSVSTFYARERERETQRERESVCTGILDKLLLIWGLIVRR
jgi:hypothetical protein